MPRDVQPWGFFAAVAALLAFFTKAAAAFFVGALGLDALLTLWLARAAANGSAEARARRAALWTLAGFAASGAIALAVFVIPYWTEFRFYNWQMSVIRKPWYSVKAILDRVSWIPIIHDFFTRQWLVTALALTAVLACSRAGARWHPPSVCWRSGSGWDLRN